jgi:hypothetical protein
MKVKLIKEWVKSENGWVSKARGVHLRHLCGNDRNKHRHMYGASYSFVVDEAEGKLLSMSGRTGHWVLSVRNPGLIPGGTDFVQRYLLRVFQ